MVVNLFESVSHNALVSYQYSYQTLLADVLHRREVLFARPHRLPLRASATGTETSRTKLAALMIGAFGRRDAHLRRIHDEAAQPRPPPVRFENYASEVARCRECFRSAFAILSRCVQNAALRRR